MEGESTCWHEKLNAYQLTLTQYSFFGKNLFNDPKKIAAIDHLDRAMVSIMENIATGNSYRSKNLRQKFLGYAYGSTLESAACLDILKIKNMLDKKAYQNSKQNLFMVTQMLIGLIKSVNKQVKEEPQAWQGKDNVVFDYERLNVYKKALEFIRWAESLNGKKVLNKGQLNKLDMLSTSIVLNIAEGNGRITNFDHLNFIHIAQRSTLKSMVLLDILKTHEKVSPEKIHSAKNLLNQIAKMLVGLQGYIERDKLMRDYD